MLASRSTHECVYQAPHLPFQSVGVAWAHSPAHWRPCHFHRELELNLVTRGRGRFRVDVGEHELSRGELLWLPPHTGHELISASADFDMWVVAFEPEFIGRFDASGALSSRAIEARSTSLVRLDAETLERLAPPLAFVLETLRQGRAPPPTRIADLLAEFLRVSAPKPNREPLLHLAVRRARSLLLEEPSLGRKELARRLDVSESTLAHVFKSGLGVGLNEYRNRTRFARLLELLEEGEPSLLQAALSAGFGSAAQYHRCVRALTGLSPSQLRNAEVRRSLDERVRAPFTSVPQGSDAR